MPGYDHKEPIRQYERIPNKGKISKKIVDADIIKNKSMLQLNFYNKKGEHVYSKIKIFDPIELEAMEKKYLSCFKRIT